MKEGHEGPKKTPSHAIEPTPQELERQEEARLRMKLGVAEERLGESTREIWRHLDRAKELEEHDALGIQGLLDERSIKKEHAAADDERERFALIKAARAKLEELIAEIEKKRKRN